MFAHDKFGPLVDATPARENLAPMVAMGVSASFIYQLTGVSNQLVARIMAGRETARQHHVETLAGLSMQTVIDADPLVHIGDVRDRINHASRAGWSQEHLAREIGIHQTTLSSWQTGRSQTARLSAVRRFQALYAHLEGTPGPHAMSAHIVEAKRPAMLRKRQERAAERQRTKTDQGRGAAA